MKKFFALFLVVALLAVAGSAFAATPDVGGHGNTTPPDTTPTTNGDSTDGGSKGETYTEYVPKVQVQTVIVRVITIAVPVVNVRQTVTEVLTGAGLAADVIQTIQQAISNAVTTLLTTTKFSGAQAIASTTLSTEGVRQRVPETASREQKLAAATQSIPEAKRNTETPAAVIPAFKATQTGVVTMPFPKFGQEFYGKKPSYYPGARGRKASSQSVKAAVDEDTYEFLNSKGESVDVIPGERENDDDAEPGFVSVAAYLEEGEEYDPVVTVPTADVEDSLTSNDVTVEVAEVTYTAETYVRGVEEDGYSNYVPDEVLAAFGEGFKKVPNDNFATETWSATAYADLQEATGDASGSWDYIGVAAMPQMANLDAGNYVIQITFHGDIGTNASYSLRDPDKFYFYPKDTTETKTVNIATYDEATGTTTKDRKPTDFYDTQTKTLNGVAYLAFTVANDAVVDFQASALESLTPYFAVQRNVPGTADSGDTPNEPPVVEHGVGSGPGDSSGGCSTGFTALALAVLGSFMATRKK